jgi:hypothetical protein
MANGLSNYVEAKIMDWLFKKTAFGSAPTALYFSLHSADPGDTGANELSGTGSYARAQRDPDTDNSTNTNWNAAAASGQTLANSNKLDISFPAATANWNSGSAILYWAMWDASSSGNCLFSGSINSGTGVVVLSGTTLKFTGGSPGQLVASVD